MGRCCSFWPLVIEESNSHHTLENSCRPITNPPARSPLSKRHFRHFADVIQLWLGELLHVVGSKAGSDLAQSEPVERYIDYGKVCDDRIHALDGRQRVGAAFHDFWRAIFGVVFHCDDETFRTDGNIHCAADISRAFGAGDAPVREVTYL